MQNYYEDEKLEVLPGISRVFFGCRSGFPRFFLGPQSKKRATPEENPGSFLSRRLETQNTSSSFRVSGFCGPRETENTSSGSGFSDRRNPKKCFGFPELICRDFLKSDRFLVDTVYVCVARHTLDDMGKTEKRALPVFRCPFFGRRNLF